MADHSFTLLSTRLLAALGVLAALTSGCGNSDPEQACLDFADALATSGERCGFDYETNFDEAVNSAAGGDCENIDSVRDLDAFESVCLPYIRQLTCAELINSSPNLPDACLDQLRR
jgi:hypothetical protein